MGFKQTCLKILLDFSCNFNPIKNLWIILEKKVLHWWTTKINFGGLFRILYSLFQMENRKNLQRQCIAKSSFRSWNIQFTIWRGSSKRCSEESFASFWKNRITQHRDYHSLTMLPLGGPHVQNIAHWTHLYHPVWKASKS